MVILKTGPYAFHHGSLGFVRSLGALDVPVYVISERRFRNVAIPGRPACLEFSRPVHSGYPGWPLRDRRTFGPAEHSLCRPTILARS